MSAKYIPELWAEETKYALDWMRPDLGPEPPTTRWTRFRRRVALKVDGVREWLIVRLGGEP